MIADLESPFLNMKLSVSNPIKSLLISFLFYSLVVCGCQEQSPISYGIVKLSELNQLEDWPIADDKNQAGNREVIDSPNALLENSKVIVIFGTWDMESKKYIYGILDVLNLMGFPAETITLVNVDESFFDPSGVASNLHVKRIPAIFFIKDGEVIARVDRVYEPIEEAIAEMRVTNSCTGDNP